MPGLIQESPFKTITVKELHPTFGAEVEGVDFHNLSDEQFNEIVAAMAKYGICVFRETGMSDKEHVDFSKRFGDLDDIRPYLNNGRKPRYEFYELFDAGNIDENNNVLDPTATRSHYNKGNMLFHVDSSFNPRRASFSLLHAVEIPPKGTGGDTYFADSRTAFEELPPDLKEELLREDYVAAHCLAQSRKLGSPEFFKDLNPWETKMARHKLIQRHEPSDRMNIYVAAHTHHLEGIPEEKSTQLIDTLKKHCTQDKYVFPVKWENVGDLVIWDNRCVMHRAAGGSFEGKYRRDLRRTTVHDDSPTAWGLNDPNDQRPGFKQL
ncbi:hypothetical protein B7463_g865, partial [Scytalidium lignicola]